jgi:hypothetical protein
MSHWLLALPGRPGRLVTRSTPLPFASWTQKGRRPEAATLDSGAFYMLNVTASNALSWVKPAVRACAAFPFMISLACRGGVSLHVFC